MGRVSKVICGTFLAAGILPVEAQLHFASLGSWGRNSKDQKAVAQTLKANAHRPPISFIASPGSNFMEGVSDLEDARWDSHFENIYAGPELNLPFFVALGANDWDGNVTAMVLRTNITYGKPLSFGGTTSHSHGGDSSSNSSNDDVSASEESLPSNREIDRRSEKMTLPKSYMGPRWTLPNFYYHYTQSFPDTSAAGALMAAPEVSAFFIFIDTKILGAAFPIDPMTSQHWNDLRKMAQEAAKTYDWVLVVGDQAIFSSGSSGGSDYLRNNLRPLFKEHLIDAYISGSDQDLELIEDGSLTHINCGAAGGSAAGRLKSHDSSVFFASTPGYCLHTLTSKTMRTTFIDGYSGKKLYDYHKLRNLRPKRFQDRLFHINRIPAVTYLPLPPGVGGSPGGIFGTQSTAQRPNTIFVLLCGGFGLFTIFFIFSVALATMSKRLKHYTRRHL